MGIERFPRVYQMVPHPEDLYLETYIQFWDLVVQQIDKNILLASYETYMFLIYWNIVSFHLA
jgi:hypothetical protein